MRPGHLSHGALVAVHGGQQLLLAATAATPTARVNLEDLDSLVAGTGGQLRAVVVHLRVVDYVLVGGVHLRLKRHRRGGGHCGC